MHTYYIPRDVAEKENGVLVLVDVAPSILTCINWCE
jgi:hypothetical protein